MGGEPGLAPHRAQTDEPDYSLTRACPRLGPHEGAEQRCRETGLSWAELSLPLPWAQGQDSPLWKETQAAWGLGVGDGGGVGRLSRQRQWAPGMPTHCAEPVLRARPCPLLCCPEKAPAHSGSQVPCSQVGIAMPAPPFLSGGSSLRVTHFIHRLEFSEPSPEAWGQMPPA